MRWMWLLIAVLAPGCSAPILFIPVAVNKPQEVRVYVAPVKDNTKSYDTDIGMEKYISSQISNKFKGIIVSGEKEGAPVYRKIPNPYRLVSTADSADVVIKTEIEQIYYGARNQSVMAGFLAFGLVGAAIADNNNSKVLGIIAVRTAITTPSGNVLLLKVHSGESGKERPEKLTRSSALKQAAQDLSEDILLMVSKANDSNDAKKYYRINAEMKAVPNK